MVRVPLRELDATSRVMVEREDGAMICAHVFSPEGVTEAPGRPFGVDFSLPPLVLLHGNGEDSATMAPLIDHFRTQRTVVAVDSRGQGLSSRGTGPLTYEVMAADVLEVMSRLSITRAHVAGYSDGAMVGLLMAGTARHRVLTLTSIGANLTPEGLTEACRQEIRDQLAALGPSPRPEPGTPGWHASVQELLGLMLAEPHITGSALAAIRCPVLVLAGEHDVVRPEETARIAQAVPDARLVVAAGAGHDLVWERTDLVLRETQAQMARHDPALRPRAPRVRPGLRVVPVGPEHWEQVRQVYEHVLDTCEGPDADTSGWRRGHWPDFGNVRAHLEAGSMRACFRTQDLDEKGRPLPGACALGVMSQDHDIAVDESVLNWPPLAPDQVLCLHLFATDPGFRGCGAADALLAAFLEEGLAQGVEAFRLNTSPENVSSNCLYQNRGFRLYRAAYFPYRGLALTPWSNCYELTAEDARRLRG